MCETPPAQVEGLTTVSQTWGTCSVQIILNGDLHCAEGFLKDKIEAERIVATRISHKSTHLLIGACYDAENSWCVVTRRLTNLRFLWDAAKERGSKNCYIALT